MTLLGALLVLEGIPYFAFPKKVKDWAMLLHGIPEKSLRLLGLVTMIAGLLLLYAIRSIVG